MPLSSSRSSSWLRGLRSQPPPNGSPRWLCESTAGYIGPSTGVTSVTSCGLGWYLSSNIPLRGCFPPRPSERRSGSGDDDCYPLLLDRLDKFLVSPGICNQCVDT